MKKLFTFLTGVVILLAAGLCAGESAPVNVAWSGTDTLKRPVAVPSEKTSILVFLRPDQPQSEDEIKLLATMLKGRSDVQVIGVVSGDEAVQGSGKLTATGSKWSWPVVTDGDYGVSGKFSVQVWPMTLVVGPGGEQVGRIAGLPVSLENDLPAYLDFAAKKIDRGGLDKRLADREVVKDSTDQKAARHVEVAQRLAVKGMPDDAKKELANALALGPKDASIQLSIVRTELMVGDAKEAERMLGKLKDAAVSGAELHLLQGWCAVESGRWDEAKKVLLEGAKLNPDPGETFYLLGRVFEHEGDGKTAAEYYRKAFEHTAAGKGMGVKF